MQLGPSEIIKPAANQPAVELQAGQDSAETLQKGEDAAISTTTTKEPVAIERLMNRLSSNDSVLPNALLIGGVLLMVIIMMRLLRKNHKADAKRSNKQLSPSKRIANIHAQANATMEPAYKVMVDAEEMARRLGATLDNKAARLELLIEEADRKLAILNRSLANPVPSALEDQSAPIQPSRTIDPSLLDRARMEQDLEERQTRVVGRIEPNYPQPQPSPAPEPVIEEPKSIQSQVIELAASGLSNIEIAHQLKQPIGQVELILNLRKQQG